MINQTYSFRRYLYEIIPYLYQLELLNLPFSKLEHDLKDVFIKQIFLIEKLKEKLKKKIIKYLLSSWKWERLPALERAILLYGSFALNVFDPPLVISECIKYTKEFIFGNSYQYINAVLDNLYKELKQKNIK